MGASSGGIETLLEIVRDLPADLPAAVFLVLHMRATGEGLLARIFGRAAKMEVTLARDREHIRRGCIYVASPDLHLLVEHGYVRVTRGPKENNYRPAIDALFRTAAFSYGKRVIGVVLSGSLDDGTAGLLAIKQRGGLAVVQDPQDALFPAMPRHALRAVEVDYCLPKSEIGPALVRLTNKEI